MIVQVFVKIAENKADIRCRQLSRIITHCPVIYNRTFQCFTGFDGKLVITTRIYAININSNLISWHLTWVTRIRSTSADESKQVARRSSEWSDECDFQCKAKKEIADSQQPSFTDLWRMRAMLISVSKAPSRQWVQTQLYGRPELTWSTAITFIAITSVPNYTAWWQRFMCANSLPRVACYGTVKPQTVFVTFGCRCAS